MFASLPIFLLLLLQGFARHDGAELFCSTQDLVNVPVHAKSLRAFDELFATLSLSGNSQKNSGESNLEVGDHADTCTARISHEGVSRLEDGYLEIQRSRDGPNG